MNKDEMTISGSNTMTDSKTIIVKMILDHWNSKVQQADKLFASLTDDQFKSEIAPGKNRGIYLLGHLTAVHDMMVPLLNLGEQMYPSLNKIFIESPDKAVAEIPSLADLKSYWNKVNNTLEEHFKKIQPDEWFQKHN